MANEPEKFWRAKDSWPSDWPGYVFLLNAFERAGEAILGKAWEGTEGLTVAAGPPDQLNYTIEARKQNPSLEPAAQKGIGLTNYIAARERYIAVFERART